MLEDVYFTVDPQLRFTFYLDPSEPINSDDPMQNVNPEVVCCRFLDAGAIDADERKEEVISSGLILCPHHFIIIFISLSMISMNLTNCITSWLTN